MMEIHVRVLRYGVAGARRRYWFRSRLIVRLLPELTALARLRLTIQLLKRPLSFELKHSQRSITNRRAARAVFSKGLCRRKEGPFPNRADGAARPEYKPASSRSTSVHQIPKMKGLESCARLWRRIIG